jgi:hypothetical protein
MIERVRRAREEFERRANAFQGPDWPHYDKRIIVGKKKKAEATASSEISQPQGTSPIESDKVKE